MLSSLNEPSGGTARRHEKSQIEARALTCVVETDYAGGAVATSGTEADRNSELKAAVDQQTCDVQNVCSARCPRNKDVKHVRSPKELLTRKERKAAGRALRDKCSRRSHATWRAPRNRRDPVELLIQSNKDRIPNLIPIRYGRMMQSPFAFYRGAAAIMAADLALTPTSGIRVQACGDCHLMNFGGFGTPERRIIFDINDFDETLPAPWEWDLKRLAVSFVLAGRNNGFKEAESRKAALRCIQNYHEHMHCYAEIGALEMWYQRMDNMVACIKSRKWKKIVQKQIAKATTRTVAEYDFPKLASVKNGKVRIKDNPPLIFHPTRSGSGRIRSAR